MIKPATLKTVLLGLAVLLITTGIFVALPAIVPSFKDIGCDNLIHACSFRASAPKKYFIWIWPTPEQPSIQEWKNVLVESEYYEIMKCTQIMGKTYSGESSINILQYIHRALSDEGRGKLRIALVNENENQIIISGYLQYGLLTGDDIITKQIKEQYIMNAQSNLFDSDPIYKLLIQYPLPEMKDVLRNSPLTVVLVNHYKENVKEEEYHISTDRFGYFYLILKPDVHAEYYMIGVSNDEQTIVPNNSVEPISTYLKNKVWYSTRLNCTSESYTNLKKDKNRPWLVIILPPILLAICIVFCWYMKYKRRTVKVQKENPLPVKENEKFEFKSIQENESDGDLSRIELVFPDIKDSLSAVWGINEPLTVTIILKNESGEVLMSQPCEIEWGDKKSDKTVSIEKGATIYHTFRDKGQYTIKTSYVEKTRKKVSSWRKIRIVDYREEMVRLFGEMLETLNLGDVKIEPDMTPREVERILSEKMEGISKESIHRVIDGFEEANYSTHTINRESYVRMYRAVREMISK